MEPLEYKVKATKEIESGAIGFLFNPSDIKIHIGNKETIVTNQEKYAANPEDPSASYDILNVHVTLTEVLKDGSGTIVQNRKHKIPVSVIEPAIVDFSVADFTPVIDTEVLNMIFSTFNLQLVL